LKRLCSPSETVGVVYLARGANGLEALERFVASYTRFPAGAEHELIVLYKGFIQSTELKKARLLFRGLPHRAIEVSDDGYDIGSYLETCYRVSQDYLCFFNTHSELVSAGWLASLAAHGSRDEVGIVGAMGSYESLASTVQLLESAIYTACTSSDKHYRLAQYFDFLLPRFRPDWYGTGQNDKLSYRCTDFDRQQSLRGTALIWEGAPEMDLSLFSSFPNPHIRSNAFLIRRALLLSNHLAPIRTKVDANLFESGTHGLTAQICRSGRVALVVGRDGRGYDLSNWPRSNTFRLANQQNLWIEDNHTRAFASMSKHARLVHQRMTWGDYLGPAPEDFPDLGLHFEVGQLPFLDLKA
jgi:hypothetical protein